MYLVPFQNKFKMGTRVYLGRLSHHAREKDVERFFKGYGKIRDVMLKNGYGFVVSYFQRINLHIVVNTIFMHLILIFVCLSLWTGCKMVYRTLWRCL